MVKIIAASVFVLMPALCFIQTTQAAQGAFVCVKRGNPDGVYGNQCHDANLDIYPHASHGSSSF